MRDNVSSPASIIGCGSLENESHGAIGPGPASSSRSATFWASVKFFSSAFEDAKSKLVHLPIVDFHVEVGEGTQRVRRLFEAGQIFQDFCSARRDCPLRGVGTRFNVNAETFGGSSFRAYRPAFALRVVGASRSTLRS